ncbi:DUF1178 family protein [Salinarimonas ramus]|uniref:DUF1178 family protein n=1 Tax=Salinarimonas ramus TaxID=690164 RepID=A0A917V5G6_9HYPH|nr:DUF1178 family protein [Salinarimonas ramus]GGK40465.1 hypothetical protein GCM10011322_29530 [Salinarimonas ramus]
MIRYALACSSGHSFESWFPSSDAYEEQVVRGLVTCPVCGTAHVEKRIMAPSVARTDRATPRATDADETATPAPSPAPGPAPAAAASVPVPAPPPEAMALLGEAQREMREALRRFRAHIESTAENVGRNFPDEARRIHAGDAPERVIMGEANREEVAELLEEGVPIAPLPILPDERN